MTPSGISFGYNTDLLSGTHLPGAAGRCAIQIDGHFLGHSAQDSVAVVESALADLNGRNA